jgi:hypothetical protein
MKQMKSGDCSMMMRGESGWMLDVKGSLNRPCFQRAFMALNDFRWMRELY